MRIHRTWWLAAAFTAGAVALGRVPSGLTEESKPEPLKIGVVNLRQVFTESRRAKDFEIRLRGEQKTEEAEIARLEERMQKLMKEIEDLVKDGTKPEILKDKRRELIQIDALRRFRADDWNLEVKRGIESHTATLFNDVTDTINTFGREHGYDLIMKIETGPIAPSPDEPVNDRIARRMVLYANPALDITKEIQTRFEPPPKEEDNK